MATDEKIRSLINPRLREIHANIQGTLSMGDLAVYVGQPMQDAMEELAKFIETDRQLLIDAVNVLDDLEDVFDRQVYDEQARRDFDVPDDYEFQVTVTAKQLRAIGKVLAARERKL